MRGPRSARRLRLRSRSSSRRCSSQRPRAVAMFGHPASRQGVLGMADPPFFYAKPKSTARAARGWGRPRSAAFDGLDLPARRLSGNERHDAFRTTSAVRPAAPLVAVLGILDEVRPLPTERISLLCRSSVAETMIGSARYLTHKAQGTSGSVTVASCARNAPVSARANRGPAGPGGLFHA
jgi:hypothetical protein